MMTADLLEDDGQCFHLRKQKETEHHRMSDWHGLKMFALGKLELKSLYIVEISITEHYNYSKFSDWKNIL